jgi:hypothetical protein
MAMVRAQSNKEELKEVVMKSKRLMIAGLIAAVSVYFAPGAFAAGTFYPTASPNI